MNNETVANDNKIKLLNRIGLIVSVINIAVCLIFGGIVLIDLFARIFNADSGGVSGWFVFFLPIIMLIYFIAIIPDILCLVFSICAYRKEKKRFLILNIIMSVIGYLIITSGILNFLISEFKYLKVMIHIHIVLKLIICIYNLFLLIYQSRKLNN